MTKELRSFLRMKQVKAAIGLSKSWIHEAIKRGDFPAPISLGARAVAWDAEAIAKWQANRIKQAEGER
jgi:prophage regulatory protein